MGEVKPAMLYLYWKKDAQKMEGLLTGIGFVGIFTARFLLEFIKNNQGILTEKAIDYKQDIKPVVQALAAYIKDDTLGIVHRIAFLRRTTC